MAYYVMKLVISAALIVLISEVSKRSSFLGAILASVPLVSVLAMMWLYIDTKSAEKVAALSTSVFWLVIPSLSLFVLLPVLLRQQLNFYLSLTISLGVMIGCYLLTVAVLERLGVEL